MPRTTRKIVLVPLVAAALSVAGCSSVIPGTAAPTGAAATSGTGGTAGSGGTAPATTDDPVAWADQVCGALLPLADASKAPDLDTSGDPQKLFDGLGAARGKLSDGAGSAVTALDKVGPSPTKNGDKLVENLKGTLTTLQKTTSDAKTTIDKVDVNDPSSLTELEDTLTKFGQLDQMPDPTQDFQNDAELKAAFDKAANCQKISLSS